MLEGILKYKDKDLGEVEYSVQAKDSFNGFKLRINAYDIAVNAALAELEKREAKREGREIPEPEVSFKVVMGDGGRSLEQIRQDIMDKIRDDESEKGYYIGPVEITEEERERWNPLEPMKRGIDITNTNKFRTNLQNMEMATRVTALITYATTKGENEEEKVIGDEFSSTRLMTVREDKTGKKIGEYVQTMGLVTEMHIENEYIKLDLYPVEDESKIEAIFTNLKEEDKWKNRVSPTPVKQLGFKFSEGVLGFEYEPPVVKEITQAFGVYETIEDVIEAHPEKDSSWILDRKYEIVADENLDEIIEGFLNHDGPIAYDTETTGLDITFKSRQNKGSQLVGVVLSKEMGTGYYFPLQHKLFANLCDGDHKYFMERYMRELLETKDIICHNLSYDWKVTHIYDINLNCVFDTMLAFGVTYGYKEPGYAIGLSSLVKNIFNLDMFDLADFIIGGNFKDSEIKFWDLNYELVRQYAPVDADMTLSLYEYIREKGIIQEFGAKQIIDLEVRFSKVVAYSEFYGYKTPVERIQDLEKDILDGMDAEYEKMKEIAGVEFNPNSSQQLKSIMYDEDKLAIPPVDDRKSTDKGTLKILRKEENPDGSPKYPFVKHLKDYRDYAGIYKNFLKRLPEFSTEDGYIFASVMQIGTTTGRCSVNNPNYQSYNDTVKKYIVPRPGYIIMDCDYSQIEYRVLSSLAGQEQLIEAFNDPDLDYHTYQASRMFSKPYAMVTPQLRQQSKGVNFGLPYGMADPSLGAAVFGERTPENTRKAGELRKRFFEGQERIEKLFETVRDFGVREGFTKTHFGRRRYYDRGRFDENAIRRQAGNHVIQGTAADVYKIGVVQLFEEVVKRDWLGKVLFNAFVHDEILMEVHEDIDPYEFIKVWREAFEVKVEGFCRLYAGLGAGYCWYDAKNNDFPPQYLDEICAKADEVGREWDGDHKKFLKELYDNYEKYKTQRVIDYIRDEETKGEILKPAVGTLLMGEVQKVVKAIQEEDKGIGIRVNKLYNERVKEHPKYQEILREMQEIKEKQGALVKKVEDVNKEINRRVIALGEEVKALDGVEKKRVASEGIEAIKAEEKRLKQEVENEQKLLEIETIAKNKKVKRLKEEIKEETKYMVDEIKEEVASAGHKSIVDEYNEMLGIELIPREGSIPREVDGKANTALMDIQNQLKIFCKYHGLDYETECEIESAESYAQKEEARKQAEREEGIMDFLTDSFEVEDNAVFVVDPEQQRLLVLQTFGYNVDEENKILHIAETFFYKPGGVEGGTKRLNDRGYFKKLEDVVDIETGKKKVREEIYGIKYYPKVKAEGNKTATMIDNMVVLGSEIDIIIGLYNAWLQSGMGVIA